MKPLLGVLILATLTAAGEVRIDGHAFRVPDGFTVEKVAGPPLVDRPIVADFDELGRLYVADSSGSNEAPEKQLANPTHRIVRLEDADGDGKYDKSVVYADKMMFPEGAMWREGSLYVAAPPSIWKLTDTDGDGKCDKREEWFQGKTLTGCANDLHGPYNGPDGMIYWCKGAFAEQTYTLPNGKPFKTRAAHIFRAKPDGTGIEPVMTGGMDNPVEVAWSPEGEIFFTTTFLQHPGGGRRDGIIHATYGGIWGKDHDVLDGHIRTGPDLSPVMTHLGPAAPSGLMRYESAAFGTAYKDNLFVAQFNMHKVSRHVLEPAGATFKTADSDLLTVADHQDFHPTDVLEDADGSMLVLDTGGWYKLCCPTSQIGKPDVLGAIYRVRRINAETFEDPRGMRIDWAKASFDDLFGRLADPRPVVKRRAIEALGRGGEAAAKFLRGAIDREVTAETRRNAAWALTRIPGRVAAIAATDLRLNDDPGVRQVAWHAYSRHSLDFARDDLDFLDTPILLVARQYQPQTARAALEAVGRLRLAKAPLFEILGRYPGDRVIEQAVIRAMIEMDDPALLCFSLEAATEDQAAPLLIAIEQIGHRLPQDALERAIVSGDKRLREGAEWIVGRHPEYGDALAQGLASRLAEGVLNPAGAVILVGQLARFANAPKVQAVLATALDAKAGRRKPLLMALRAAARSDLDTLPDEWRGGLIAALSSQDPEVAKEAVAVARAVRTRDGVEALGVALRAVADREVIPAEVRLDALAAIPGNLGALSGATFEFLRGEINPDKPVSTRLLAADVLARASLKLDQLGVLADALKTAGPIDAPRLLAAFDRASDEETGRRLISALKESPALASMRADDLKARFAKFGDEVAKEAESLYALIARANADQLARLDDLARGLGEGDVRRGQAVFNGTKAACATCHAIGYLGGNVGPDLSRIGAIRDDRDLLESIVFPSASFVRSYEPMVVATTTGQVHSGLLKKDTADEVVLVTGADKEVRIPRAEVEAMRPGTASVMPSGLDSQMTRAELTDLIAFLRSRK